MLCTAPVKMTEDAVAVETPVLVEHTATISVEQGGGTQSRSSKFSAWVQHNLWMFRRYWRRINLWYAVSSIPVAVFDTASDWWIFCEYVRYGEGVLGASVGVVCFVGTILFCVDLYVSFITIRFYSKTLAPASGPAAGASPGESGKEVVSEKAEGKEETKEASEEESEKEEDDETKEEKKEASEEESEKEEDDETKEEKKEASEEESEKEEDDETKEESQMLNAASDQLEDAAALKAKCASDMDNPEVVLNVVCEADDTDGKWSMSEEELEERRVSKWQEIISFLILLLEDFPTAVLIYLAFENGSCEVFRRLYKDTFAAQLALLSGFLSVFWKGFVSLRYAFRCRFHGMQGYATQCCCCILRSLRPFLVLGLCFFIVYIYLEIKEMKSIPLSSDDICEHIHYVREEY